jgi:very-long-chain (3R)-3-hydroxyacyl-CoA dehydratase
MGVTKMYLVCYNVVQTLVWSTALVLSVRSIVENGGSLSSVYDDAGWFVRVGQCGALMEVVHAVLGLVRSPVLTTLMQWAGRTHAIMSVIHPIPSLHGTSAAALMFLAWSRTEVIRYPSYALGANIPEWLNWLRYSAFIPLYPIGGSAEIWLMLHALPTIDAEEPYTIAMPNTANFAFHYPTFLKGLIAVYPVLMLKLYLYVFVQRGKKLGAAKGKKRD